MHIANSSNERYCLLCNKRIDEEFELSNFIQEERLCTQCRSQLKGEKRVFVKDGKKWIIYHEYNDFIERLLFRYKEQRDVALSPIFLSPYKNELKALSKKYAIVILCSSNEKRQFRAFEPLIEWFRSIHVEVYSPFYKSMDWKQSSLSFEKRKGISMILKKKELYNLPKRKILLFDDVITSGATMNRALELMPGEVIVAFAAHPSWIQKMKPYEKSCEKM